MRFGKLAGRLSLSLFLVRGGPGGGKTGTRIEAWWEPPGHRGGAPQTGEEVDTARRPVTGRRLLGWLPHLVTSSGFCRFFLSLRRRQRRRRSLFLSRTASSTPLPPSSSIPVSSVCNFS